MIKRLFETDKKLVLKFAVSLFLTILFAFVFVGVTSYAASSPDTPASASESNSGNSDTSGSGDSESSAQPGDYTDAPAQSVGSDPGSSLLQQIVGVDASQPLEIIILLTLIALLPSMLIMMTCFARIVIVLGFLRLHRASQKAQHDNDTRKAGHHNEH